MTHIFVCFHFEYILPTSCHSTNFFPFIYFNNHHHRTFLCLLALLPRLARMYTLSLLFFSIGYFRFSFELETKKTSGILRKKKGFWIMFQLNVSHQPLRCCPEKRFWRKIFCFVGKLRWKIKISFFSFTRVWEEFAKCYVNIYFLWRSIFSNCVTSLQKFFYSSFAYHSLWFFCNGRSYVTRQCLRRLKSKIV